MRKLICLLIMLTMVFGLAACSGKKETPTDVQNGEKTPAKPKILKVAKDYSNLGNLDMHLSTYNLVFEIGNTIAETLIAKQDETLELYPLLITDMPKISEDGLTYSFELKKGITFQDGSPLTSEDVVYTFNRFFDPKTKCVMTGLATMIEGSKEFLDGTNNYLTGIKASDDTHFTITLYYPYSAFTAVLAAAPLAIYPSDACEKAGDKWGIDTYIGTGPFMVESFEPKAKLTLARYDNYHGGAKKLDKIEFIGMDANTALLEYEAGNIDVVMLDLQLVDKYSADPKYKDNIKFQEYVGINTLNFNQDIKPLDNPKVREAIGLATDGETICKTYFKGHFKPAKSLLPKGIPGYDDSLPPFEYNPEKAKALLTEAGYPNGIHITATANQNSTFRDLYQILQQQYALANITLDIEQVDKAGWFDKRSTGNVQFNIFNWVADFNDPDNIMYSMYHKDNEDFMSTGNKDPEFNYMLAKGRLITDPEEKQKFYADAQYYLTRELFANHPLYTPAGYYLLSDRTTGVLLKRDYLFSFLEADIIK